MVLKVPIYRLEEWHASNINSEVETTLISLMGWPHKTSSLHVHVLRWQKTSHFKFSVLVFLGIYRSQNKKTLKILLRAFWNLIYSFLPLVKHLNSAYRAWNASGPPPLYRLWSFQGGYKIRKIITFSKTMILWFQILTTILWFQVMTIILCHDLVLKWWICQGRPLKWVKWGVIIQSQPQAFHGGGFV